MSRVAQLALLCGALCLSSGCLAHQVAKDGITFRQAIIDMYTDQAMDNLVRAHCNQPFVQLAYSDLNVTDSTDAMAAGTASRGVETARDLFMASATRTISGMISFAGNAHAQCSMSFRADPVTDQNDIYEAYLQFAHDPSLLVESDSPPPGPVHIQRRCGKKHYWVPCEAGPAFLDLVLKTSLMRGPETPPPAAYVVRILTVDKIQKDPKRDSTNGTLVFDQQVRNGAGTLIIDLDDGRRVRLNALQVDEDAEGKRLTAGALTNRLDTQWHPVQDQFTELNLINRPARLYSHQYPPEASTPPPVLRRIATDVDRIRIIQQIQKR